MKILKVMMILTKILKLRQTTTRTSMRLKTRMKKKIRTAKSGFLTLKASSKKQA